MIHTAVGESVFDKVATGITQILDVPNFAIHPTIKKMMESRRKALSAGKDIDWATAEALAFGTLMEEGIIIFSILFSKNNIKLRMEKFFDHLFF